MTLGKLYLVQARLVTARGLFTPHMNKANGRIKSQPFEGLSSKTLLLVICWVDLGKMPTFLAPILKTRACKLCAERGSMELSMKLSNFQSNVSNGKVYN